MDSGYKVRAAKPGDAEAVRTLLRASYPKLMASSYDEEVLAPALELMTRANPSLLRSGTYYLAEFDVPPLSVAESFRVVRHCNGLAGQLFCELRRRQPAE